MSCFRARMRLLVDLLQAAHVQVGVALRRAEPRMAEQFLNRAKIRARLQQVRRERVPEGVRADALGDRGFADVAADDAIDAARGEPRARAGSGTAAGGDGVRRRTALRNCVGPRSFGRLRLELAAVSAA